MDEIIISKIPQVYRYKNLWLSFFYSLCLEKKADNSFTVNNNNNNNIYIYID